MTEGRLHALDNLRALMMWLGIVLHVGAIHLTHDSPLPWSDSPTVVADLLVAFIHAFRMPVFFILAGFFVAMLLRTRGPQGMAKHRAMRLGLPFAVFYVPVFAASVTLALVFIHLVVTGAWGIDVPLADAHIARLQMHHTPPKVNTMHMWFLWMLLWMSLATALLARHVPARVWQAPAAALRTLVAAWWGPLVLAVPVLLADMGYPRGILFPSGSFLPPLSEWVHNGVFFIAGLAMYAVRDALFAKYIERRRVLALAGLAAWIAAGSSEKARLAAPFAYAYALSAWLWSFALIGFALKWMNSRSAVLGYLSESSYWVYLVHMPLTIGFGALLYLTDLPALLKIVLNIAATTVVCLASYHAFVRFTRVGVLLNGKRHERNGPSAPAYASQ